MNNTLFYLLLANVVDLWMIGAAGWLMVKIVNAVRDSILSRYDLHADDNLQARQIYTQIRLIERILTALIILFTLAFMLMISPKVRHIGISMLATAGIAGIILGFAAQKTLGNFIAGIQLALAQPIRIDDVVIVENEWGWIEEISLTYIVVRIWDLRRLVVPISVCVWIWIKGAYTKKQDHENKLFCRETCRAIWVEPHGRQRSR